MAKQESLIKLRGKLGDLSFYKGRDGGYQARMKGGVDANRIQTDPNFQRTRENMAEFGRAVKTAKRLRQQLNNLMLLYADRTAGNRLTSLVHRIQKADDTSPRGQRTFSQENSELLRGFEFNSAIQVGGLFAADLPVSYDRDTGIATLDIPSFNPQNTVTLLQGATHIQFLLAAAELDLNLEGNFAPRPEVAYSSFVPLIGLQPGETLSVTLNADPAHAVYLMVGIGVFQEVNGQHYPLKNGPFNALSILDVIR